MRSLILWLVLAAILPAQTEYFLLETGNVWVYQSSNSTATFEVADSRKGDDGVAYRLAGRGADAWLRFKQDGGLYASDGSTERLLMPFGAAEGESFNSGLACTGRGTIASRKAFYKGPIGEFDNALRVVYAPGTCADAGVTEEIYLPWIGLVRWTETTIAGPRTYDLVYTRLGNVTQVAAREVAFSLALGRTSYVVDLMPVVGPERPVPQLTARISLRHNQPQPLRLTFASGQTYELVIRNSEGKEVYRWSNGRAFTQALRTVTFGPGEKNWVVSVPLASEGEPWPPGRYTAEAWLVTTGEEMQYRSSVGFDVQHVH